MSELVKLLSKSEARALTEKIRTAGDELAEMLYQAHEGEAWRALDYDGWKSYIAGEFQMSRRHSNRLVNFIEIRDTIKRDPGVPTPSSEKQVRPLTSLPPDQQPAAWAKAVEIAGGEQPTAKQVEAAVEEILEPEPRSKPVKLSVGMEIAQRVILQLQTITSKDAQREQALRHVAKWCERQLSK